MPANQFGELANYMDLLLDAICVVDVNGQFVYVSGGSERVFGYRPDEMIGRNMKDMVHPDDIETTLAKVQETIQNKLLPYFENRYIRKDGSIAHIMWSARWLADNGFRVAVARDISSKVRYEAKQRATYAISEAANNTQDLQALLKQIHRIVGELLPIDSFSIVLLEEATAEAVLCYEVASVTEQTNAISLAQDILHSQSNLLHHTRADQSGLTCWLGAPLKRQDKVLGALLVSRHSTQDFDASDEELVQFASVQIASAVERQQMIARLQQMALYDALTQLPNRSLFEDRVNSAITRARRDQHKFCLLYIDLDRFKQVNDQHGHHIGDQLLIEISRRLKHCVRESDTVARLAGDEFVILIEPVQHDHINLITHKISHAIAATMLLEAIPLQIEASIGYALYPEHGEQPNDLLRHADLRMYAAKRGSE
jgi:diguanylate cyclase (GGDEF)-like protein/PAS domain S-box-containing protein